MNIESTEHPDPIELIQLARGTLPDERAGELREHCVECGPCGDQLAAVVLLRDDAGGRTGRQMRRWQVAAAAVLLVGVGLVALFASVELGPTGDRTGPGGASAVDALEDAGLPELQAAATPEEGSAEAYAGLASEANLVPPVVVDLFRQRYGEPVSVVSPERTFVEGLELLVADRPVAARQALERVRTARPNDLAVAGFLGIARYLAGDFSSATERLLTVSAHGADPGIAFYFRWYLANLYLRQGRVEVAEGLLRDDVVIGMAQTAESARALLAGIDELRASDPDR